MIKITTIIDTIEKFDPWSGAVSNWKSICEDPDALDYINTFLDECYPEEMTETQLNDFLWFDARDVLIEAGIWEEE